MFNVIQYVERQVVLYDAVEDATETELSRQIDAGISMGDRTLLALDELEVVEDLVELVEELEELERAVNELWVRLSPELDALQHDIDGGTAGREQRGYRLLGREGRRNAEEAFPSHQGQEDNQEEACREESSSQTQGKSCCRDRRRK